MADLIVEQGDCEFHGRCECGTTLGTIRPDQSFDVLAGLWERHVMTVCTIGPYDPESPMADLPKPPHDVTLSAINAEVLKARTKFPDNKHLLAALTEEVGELAQAMLQDRPRGTIEREAIQVACVAIRIIEEGDSAFAVKDWNTDA